jgi:hypothetical protein
MKNKYIYLTLYLLGLLIPRMHAQIVSVALDTGFNIKAGTVIGADGLDLKPASDFSFASSLSRSTIVSNPTSTTTIKRSYKFEKTTALYSGEIKINYEDSELNGLSESNLLLFYNDGAAWFTDNSSINNAAANYQTAIVISKTLNELSLSSQELSNHDIDSNLAVHFILYPNPTRNGLTIKASNNASIDKIIVIDMLGKIVVEEFPKNNYINVERFASGTYLIKAFSGDKTFFSKFIKID